MANKFAASFFHPARFVFFSRVPSGVLIKRPVKIIGAALNTILL